MRCGQTWDPKSWEVLLSIWEVFLMGLGSISLDSGKYCRLLGSCIMFREGEFLERDVVLLIKSFNFEWFLLWFLNFLHF